MLTTLQELTLNEIHGRRKGREITGAQLTKITRLVPRSEFAGADMRQVVHALRVKGYPICANGKGYYWPEDKAELDGYLESFKTRIEDQKKAYYGMQANLTYQPQEVVVI